MAKQSPLFLFDEIDHALDAENMASYVKILRYLQGKAQVIFTTFRKEVLNIEDLGISSIEFIGSSIVREVDYDTAISVLRNQSIIEEQ